METLESAQLKAKNRDFGMVVREVDEDLAIYLGMRSGEEEESDHLPVPEPDCSSAALLNSQSQPETIHAASADEEFRHVEETDKIDYDWLLSQPHTSLHPSVETGIQDSAVTLATNPNDAGVRLKYKPAQSVRKPAPSSAKAVNSSASITRKPSSSGGRTAAPRSTTPAGRPSLPAKSNSPRPSTPTLKAKLPSPNPSVVQARSKTPSKSASQISSNSSTKLTTPIRKPSTAPPSNASSIGKSSAGRKSELTTLKNPVPSSSLKSRPLKSPNMLTLSLDAPHVSKPSMPKRPASASRERQSAPTTTPPLRNEKSRQKSCSPSRVSALFTRSRGHDSGGSDEVNPVLMGTKVVERVVNMRKLAPPKQDEYSSHDYSRKSFQENSGFGRSLSKKSLDMAIRHMDIKRSISDNTD